MKKFDLRNATDTELLDRFAAGRDQAAFAEMTYRHGPMVLATARRVLSNQDDALDAFQATFFALAKSVDELRNKEAVAGWLHKAAHSCAINIRNANIRWHGKSERMQERLNSPENTTPKEVDPSLSVANEELQQLLDEEIARLPAKLQTAIVLCVLEGLSQKQIADKLGIAASTVKDRITKARALLQKRLVRRVAVLSLPSIIAGLSTFSADTASAMTSALVTDTTAKATLFAAGKTASEIGVASSVIQSSNTVITAMTKVKLMTVSLAALAVLTLLGGIPGFMWMGSNPALGGTLFNDTFDDGDFSDGSPVTWTINPVFPGRVDASSGELVISPLENAAPDAQVGIDALGLQLRDTSIRARMRVTETGGAINVVARAQLSPNAPPADGYFAGIAYLPQLGGSVVLAGRSNGAGENVNREFYPTVDGELTVFLPYDVRNEDTEIRFDLVGESYKLWVWRANGGSMPTAPQFDIIDPTHAEASGPISLVLTNNPPGTGTSSGIFDFIEVSQPVPEPSSATLSISVVAVTVLLWRRRVHRG